MWTCPKCGEQIEDQFDSCWRCATPPTGAPAKTTTTAAPPPAAVAAPVKWRAKHRTFRGTFATWDQLFDEAADFATEIGPERLINISHSADRGDGVVAVWYWADETAARSAEDLLRVAS
jgi:hypothetical protein